MPGLSRSVAIGVRFCWRYAPHRKGAHGPRRCLAGARASLRLGGRHAHQGVLEGGEHRGVRLDGPGQLVENEDAPVVANQGRYIAPQVGPAGEGGAACGRRSASDGGDEATALEISRLLLGHPVRPGQATLARPVAEQGRLTYPAATVEQEQRATRSLQQPLKHGQFIGAVYKHGSPCKRHIAYVLYCSDVSFAEVMLLRSGAIPLLFHPSADTLRPVLRHRLRYASHQCARAWCSGQPLRSQR